ncbi:catalase [Natronobacterium gregoryi SP2]|nr:Catalase [Natronobacterium gregoryi SP2]PLK17875.1 catalase [Natronobacterium gregoryi SP2]
MQGESLDSNGKCSYVPEQPGDGEVEAPEPDPKTYNDPSDER